MRDPRTGRFIAAPSLPLSVRAADMLDAFAAGRNAERREQRPLWVCVVAVAVVQAVVAVAFIVRWI